MSKRSECKSLERLCKFWESQCISFELDCKPIHQLFCDSLHLVVCCAPFNAEAVQETTEAVNSELHAEAV